MIKRDFYAWKDTKRGVFRVSLIPADCPIRPSLEFETKADVDEFARQKRARIFWDWPLLPQEEEQR